MCRARQLMWRPRLPRQFTFIKSRFTATAITIRFGRCLLGFGIPEFHSVMGMAATGPRSTAVFMAAILIAGLESASDSTADRVSMVDQAFMAAAVSTAAVGITVNPRLGGNGSLRRT